MSEEKMKGSLYIHVPFCLRKCAYCDFYSLPDQLSLKEAYVKTVCEELTLQAASFDMTEVHSIYFGGGTPTLLTGHEVKEILRTVFTVYHICPDAEITMEGNPGTLTEANLTAYLEAGVNRLSLGVQSFDPGELSMLGRIHTPEEAEHAVNSARKAGFKNLNLDLMYGLPGQRADGFERTLRRAVSLTPEHLSCYSLIVEPGTPLAVRIEQNQVPPLPGEETILEMEETMKTLLREQGFHRYEVSNYAREGFESRHNLTYWECEPYLGIGPAAHSCIGNRRFYCPDDLKKWLQGPSTERYLEEGDNQESDRRFERVMMGFRMTRGVDLARFWEDFGARPERFWPKTLSEMKKMNMVREQDGRLALTETGMDVMNYWLVKMMEEEESTKEY